MNPSTLSEAVYRYLDIRRAKVAANTFKNDRVATALMLTVLGANLPLTALTRELFEAKFFGPSGAAYSTSASTFNAYLSRLRRFTKTAVAYAWMSTDPLAGLEGRRRQATPPRQLLAPKDLLRLVEATRSPRDRIAIAIAVNTGMRASEIAGLRVSDVDFLTGYVTVEIIKTADVDRMPITAELEVELHRWFRHYRHVTGEPDLPGDWFLVPQHTYAPRHGTDGTMDYRLTPHAAVAQPYDIVQRALVELSLPTSKEGFHTIRRSVGRAYYELMKTRVGHESALVATAALLHHKDIRQTQHYIGVQPEKLERDAILRGQRFLTALTGDTPDGQVARHAAPQGQAPRLRVVN